MSIAQTFRDRPSAFADARVDERGQSATLALRFENGQRVTRMKQSVHQGPLRVQKPLYPEGGEVCHAIIVHPPGGIVGGDRLDIDVAAHAGAQVFLSTPGAAKWYRSTGTPSRQQVRLEAGANASIEWMPQESIFYDAAEVRMTHQVNLHGDARYIGTEILCFGRTGAGERLRQGAIRQQTVVRRDGRPVWFEQGCLQADGDAMASPAVLAGHTVSATLIAIGAATPATALEEVRELVRASQVAEPAAQAAASQGKTAFVVRYLGASSENARCLMLAAWTCIRPTFIGRQAMAPRIWHT